MHFYQNKVTGAVDYVHQDFKVKGVIDVFRAASRPQKLLDPDIYARQHP